MKIISICAIILLLWSGCTNQQLNVNQKTSKEELVNQANHGNIKAMVDLNRIYKFPETKEGLAYYKKWYESIDNNSKPKDIFAFAEVFGKYRDMFINGDLKYEHLLNLAKDKNYRKAFIPLFKFYAEHFRVNKEIEIQNLILQNPSKEELEVIYKSYIKNSNVSSIYEYRANEILNLMIKKGFINKIIKDYNKFSTDTNLLSSKEKEKLLNNIYNSNDLDTILKTAELLKIIDIKATNFYIKATNLTTDKAILSKSYKNIANIYRSKKDIKKAIFYYKKAIEFGDEEASIKLLNVYSRNKEYKKEYKKLVDEISKTTQGKIEFARYLDRIYKKKESNKLWNELANDKNNEAIIRQALNNQSSSFFIKKVNLSDDAKKWQTYILNSNNKDLRKKAKEEILEDPQATVMPELIENLFKNDLEEKNIITLIKLADYYKMRKGNQTLEYFTLAYEYGDVESGLTLAKRFLKSRRTIAKGIEVLENLSNKGEIKASRALANLYYYPSYRQKRFKDLDKGLEYFVKASNQGDLIATSDLLDIYLSKKTYNTQKTKIYLDKLAQMGKADALFKLGRYYLFGIDGKKDLQKAKEYFEKATKEYYPKAYYELGLLYYEYSKEKLESNNEKALKYFTIGDKLEDYDSTLILATIYNNGYIGTKKDKDLAISYYKKIAYKNSDIAYYVAYYYADKKDYKNAFKYFEKSLNRKTGKGYFELATLYENGLGVKKDLLSALKYYDEAYIKTKNPQAAFSIAYILQYDKKDIEGAKKWYKIANTKEAIKELQKIQKNTK